ncbi:MAG TPA: hypothetical protein VF913_09300 [Xanthobacteraceae bacterium]
MTESNAEETEHGRTPRLKDAMRQARIEMAERSGVVVDLRDAELARLELLNQALEAVYADIPEGVELFERGIAEGDTPRLWIDMIAHVAMGRDKRVYRFVQDTRYGRRVIAESADVDEMARAVTQYIARRLVERERVIAGDTELAARDRLIDAVSGRQRRRRMLLMLLIGLILGAAIGAGAVLGTAWLSTLR